MLRPLVPLVFVAIVVLPGCLGTRTEKIQARRPPALIEQNQRSMEPLTPSELDELFATEREARRMDPTTQRWTDHYRDTRAAVDAQLTSVSRDPWRAEELDRRRVILGRAWSDVGHETPPVPAPLPEPRGDYADPLDEAKPAPAPSEEEGGEAEESSESEE